MVGLGLRAPLGTLLCLGAHSDDAEIGCGGTVLRLLEEHPGAHIVWVVLAAGGERRDEAAFAALGAALGERPRIVAASTHDTEELAVAEAHCRLRSKVGNLVSIIAPRHPERGGAVAAAVSALGLSVRRRSEGALPDGETDVYIADTIGELGTLYATAPIAFVGGSLIPHGGQNPIEAVRHGAVVVTGSSTHNFSDAYAALVGAGGAISVAGVQDLAPTLGLLLRDPARIEAMRANATMALQGLSGALARTVAALIPYLPDGDGAFAAEDR